MAEEAETIAVTAVIVAIAVTVVVVTMDYIAAISLLSEACHDHSHYSPRGTYCLPAHSNNYLNSYDFLHRPLYIARLLRLFLKNECRRVFQARITYLCYVNE